LFRDEQGGVHVEYGMILALIGVLLGAWNFAGRNHPVVFSSTVFSARAGVTTDGRGSDRAFADKHYRIGSLSELWGLSRETVRQIVKDDPQVVKIRQGRKQAHTTYSIPESAARSIHTHYCGEDSGFDDRHYRIAELASTWAVGRETVRLMIKDEPGVLKIALGRKKSHTRYSVPASVAKRIHNRLLFAV
jgi:hypothetical protein